MSSRGEVAPSIIGGLIPSVMPATAGVRTRPRIAYGILAILLLISWFFIDAAGSAKRSALIGFFTWSPQCLLARAAANPKWCV